MQGFTRGCGGGVGMGVTTLTNAVSAILGMNLSRPGNLDHPPEFWGYIFWNFLEFPAYHWYGLLVCVNHKSRRCKRCLSVFIYRRFRA